MAGSALRGVLVGSLTLVILEQLVQPSAAARVGPLLQVPVTFAKYLIDPAVPAFSSTSGKAGQKKSGGGHSTLGIVPYLLTGQQTGTPGPNVPQQNPTRPAPYSTATTGGQSEGIQT